MKYVKILFLIINLITGCYCFAASLTPADQNMLQEQQKTLLEEAQKQRQALKQSFNIQTSIPETPTTQAPLCFVVNTIVLKGAEHLSPKEKDSLVNQYLNQCLSVEQIQFLVKSITNYYISQGFITSSAYLEEQDISNGELIISIMEGKVEAITLDGQSSFILKMAFPHIVNNVLNLRDIEQGLEQLNRLQSQKVSIDILPGNEDGYSIIELKSEKQKTLPMSFGLNINNNGQRATGVGQLGANVSIENILNMAELWQFSVSTNSNLRNNLASRSFSGQLTIPYGYWIFDYLYSGNNSYYDMPLVYAKWRYKSQNQLQRFMINRLLYRDNDTKVTLTTNFSHKNNTTIIAGEKLAVSSPTLNILSGGVNYSTVVYQGYFTFNPAVSQGLLILDSTPDKSKPAGMPKSQFTKVTVSSSYYKPINESMSYLTSFFGQVSKQNLYSTERISVGGEYSVRGFKEDSITGNEGFYWRNELTYSKNINSFIDTLSVTGALDTGWIKNKKDQIDGGNMTGVAMGLNLSDNNYYNISLSIGKPLFYPEEINPDHWVSYFQLSLNF